MSLFGLSRCFTLLLFSSSCLLFCVCGLRLTWASLAEEAQTSVKGMEENAVHAKYIELVSPSSSIPTSKLLFGPRKLTVH